MARDIKLIALNLTKIYAERLKELPNKLKVNPGNIRFISLEKQEIPISNEPCLKFSFEFKIEYEDYAEIGIAGFLIFLTDKASIKECLKSWEQKTLPDDIRLNLINIILQKCSLKSLQLEEELLLPLHVKMPHVLDSPKTED